MTLGSGIRWKKKENDIVFPSPYPSLLSHNKGKINDKWKEWTIKDIGLIIYREVTCNVVGNVKMQVLAAASVEYYFSLKIWNFRVGVCIPKFVKQDNAVVRCTIFIHSIWPFNEFRVSSKCRGSLTRAFVFIAQIWAWYPFVGCYWKLNFIKIISWNTSSFFLTSYLVGRRAS